MNLTKYCTYCKKSLDGIGVYIEVDLFVDRRVGEEWEKINNSKVKNSEFICIECFDVFSNLLEKYKKD